MPPDSSRVVCFSLSNTSHNELTRIHLKLMYLQNYNEHRASRAVIVRHLLQRGVISSKALHSLAWRKRDGSHRFSFSLTTADRGALERLQREHSMTASAVINALILTNFYDAHPYAIPNPHMDIYKPKI